MGISKKQKKILLIFLIVILSISVIFILILYLIKSQFNLNQHDTNIIKNDSSALSIKSDNDSIIDFELDSLSIASVDSNYHFSGKKISILVTGIDARLNSTCIHADANHLITFWMDSGLIEITSIPRGTFADAGLPDSLMQNYLANVRACKGRTAYMNDVTKIAGIDKIDYYVEFGFSQAIGLLELLGFQDRAVSTLRVLRSRKSFKRGDYQRSYNQGQFIRQVLLKFFNKVSGPTGDLVLYGALSLVDTDLNMDILKYIISQYKAKGFPHSAKDVVLRLKPAYSDLEHYNFIDDRQFNNIHNYVVKNSPKDSNFYREKTNAEVSDRMAKQIASILYQALKASKRNPDRVIKLLEIPFKQRIYLQVTDVNKRNYFRATFKDLLYKAYTAKGDTYNAKRVKYIVETEEKAYNNAFKRK